LFFNCSLVSLLLFKGRGRNRDGRKDANAVLTALDRLAPNRVIEFLPMRRIYDDEEWVEQHDLDECDYLDGYITCMEGGSDHWSETRAWRAGFKAAKVEAHAATCAEVGDVLEEVVSGHQR